MKNPPKAFITYSHKNSREREILGERLAVMEQNGDVALWSDAKILPGDKWEKEIGENLAASDLLLYLVSAASLASKNCNKELTDILGKNEHVKAIPILLEETDFEEHRLGEFEALPKDGGIKPISKWNPKSSGWQNVVAGIREKVKNLPSAQPQPQPPAPSAGGAPLPPSAPASPVVPLTPTQATVDFLFQRANFFLFLGNHAAAIPAYTKILSMAPGFAPAYNNRGTAYAEQGNYELAFADYDNAVKFAPDTALVYNNRGNVYAKQAEQFFARAIKDYGKAIELNPGYATAHNNLGNALFEKGRFGDAATRYKEAIRLNPNYAEAHKHLGAAYFEQGSFDLAIPHYEKAIELKPGFAEAHAALGDAKMKLGDHKGAKKDYQTALQLAEKQENKNLAECIRKLISAIPPEAD